MNIKIPVWWLREYVKTDVSAKTIANLLSLAGPSIEKVTKRGEDWIFEVEVTTNRADAFSVWGLAREAWAILAWEGQKAQLVKPKGLNLALEPDTSPLLPLEVTIKDRGLCPRFTAIIVEGVKIRPSPAIIRNRLEAAGIRSINNIVDITNYLMLELGQPMHTFDWDKIKGAKMILRAAREGEKIKTLDGQTRKLPKGAIVIEDSEKLIDLAGIMGGANSQITRRTRRVVLFVQAYDRQTIRKTTQALGFRTEAASRFEKGVDLEAIPQALARAVYLAKKTAGAKIASELIDIYYRKPKAKQVEIGLAKVNQYLGINLKPQMATRILESLGFMVKLSDQKIKAEIPSWRLWDIEDGVDLVEEIARIYGYWRLPQKIPTGQIPVEEDSSLEGIISLKNALKYLGLVEIISYSIIPKEFLELAGAEEKKSVELTNPLTSEWQFMRPTLLISLVDVIAKNQNIRQNLKVFEIAKTYVKQDNDLPKQDLMLSIALQNGDFYQIKGIIENVLGILNHEARWQELTVKSALFAKGESAQIVINGHKVGQVGMLDTRICNYFGIEGPIAVCEINLTT
ncbi:phenylalanine--tRNA ligase subunit beta, partial [Candidatus Curtissbacteria bacterium]|nr:phenylalanine--tRNA ligase subunit beta [Candidatus Curtissbacteria bacterium]